MKRRNLTVTVKNTCKHLNKITEKHFASPNSNPLLICVEGNTLSGKTWAIKFFLTKMKAHSSLYINTFSSDFLMPRLSTFEPENTPDILVIDEATHASSKELKKFFAQPPSSWTGIVILVAQKFSDLPQALTNNSDTFPNLFVLNTNSKDALPKYLNIKN